MSKVKTLTLRQVSKTRCNAITLKGEKCKNLAGDKGQRCHRHAIPSPQSKRKEDSDVTCVTCVTCVCCLELLNSDQVSLACAHTFHGQCLSKLIKKECPLCRAVIDDKSVDKKILRNIAKNTAQARVERDNSAMQDLQGIVENIQNDQSIVVRRHWSSRRKRPSGPSGPSGYSSSEYETDSYDVYCTSDSYESDTAIPISQNVVRNAKFVYRSYANDRNGLNDRNGRSLNVKFN